MRYRIHLLIGLFLALSVSARAAVNEKKYFNYQNKLTELLRVDVNDTKKISKMVDDITRNGDADQCFWWGTTLARIDAESVNEKTRPIYQNWAKKLVLRMMSMEPEFIALADGRSPIFLEDAFFCPNYDSQGKLTEMLSLLLDVCDVLNVKKTALQHEAAVSIFEEKWRVRAHYLEKTIYGDDHYSTNVIGTTIDPAILASMKFVLGSDAFIEAPYMLLKMIVETSPTKYHDIVVHEEDFYTFSHYYLSSLDINLLGSAILYIAGLEGVPADQESHKRMAVYEKLFPATAEMGRGMIEAMHSDNMESEVIASFLRYQEELRNMGKEFVNYAPAMCPNELMEDSLFDEYCELYARVGYALCKEMGKAHASVYINMNGATIRNLLPTVGYGDTSVEWLTRLGLYLTHLLDLTVRLYEKNHAAWTVGAMMLETRILTEFITIRPIDDIYYELVYVIPWVYDLTGDEEYVKILFENYILLALPSVNLNSPDKNVNCWMMDFYAKVIQYLFLFDEPLKSELEEFYVKRFEKAVKRNKCDWQAEHVLVLANHYFYKKDSLKLNQYLDELLELTQDTALTYAYRYTYYGMEIKNFDRAVQYVEWMNRSDSSVAASYWGFSGLNPAYVYARVGQREKVQQQLNIFNHYIRQQFATQLLTVGGEQASKLIKRQEEINDFFVQADDEIEDEAIRGEFAKEFYNWQLFSKGLLLALNKESEQILENHPSQMVRDLYKQLSRMETQLSTMTNRESFEAQMLQSNISVVRNNLMQTIRAYIDENNVSTVHLTSWSDVRDALQPHEAAIEIAFGKLEDDTINTYYALLLRYGDQAPTAVRLCTEPDLTRLVNGRREPATIDALYQYGRDGKRLAQLIWSPILPYLQEGDRIYFSASGALHQIAVEAIPLDAKYAMIDKYDVVRVSSTREVTKKGAENEAAKATLYGGIRYDVDTAELAAQSRRYPQLAMRSMESMDTLNRGRVLYLPGTQVEIDQIAQTLKDKEKEVQIYSSVEANEESFKSLSGSHPNILHLATHGFYWPLQTAQSLSELNQYSVQYLTDPLNRCGLLFAGANTALSGHSERLAPGVQDGILTAKEISLLDFTGTDLVVLSACETALGDISGEGVFGLQRAFKMAGAQTILMALWQVNDEATRMLMTAFYRHYTAGESKREAFRNAQQEVRSSKYKSPYFWAGFVLLD